MKVKLSAADLERLEGVLEADPGAGLCELYALIVPGWDTAGDNSFRPGDYVLERAAGLRLVEAAKRGGGFLLWLNVGPGVAI